MSEIREASVYVTAVRIEYAGAQLVGNHAVGVTGLVVDDPIEFNEGAGELLIAGDTLAYTDWDDDTSTIVLAAPTTVAYSADERIRLLPLTPVKVADVVDIQGASIPAIVWHTLDAFLPEQIFAPNEQPTGTIFYTGDYDKVWLVNVPGKVAAMDPETIDYPSFTNLYTDPKPTDPANWLGGLSSGGGGIFNPTIVADSTYADLGLHLKFTSSSIGTGIGCSFSPNGSGLTADPSVTGVYGIGTTAKVLPFTDNLSYSFKFYAPVGAPTFTPRLKFFDAAGSVVSVGDLGTSTGVVTFPAGTNGTYRGYLDYDAIIASAPTVASVLTTITVNTAGNGQAVYLGSAMGNFGTELMPYRDDDSTGWVTNEDGTSTGRINLDTIVSWQDLVGTQPPPPAHTHVAADITDFNTAVRTSRLDQMAAPTADVAFGSRKITGLADGTSAQHAATKNQVDTSTVQLTATHQPADNTAMVALSAKKGDVAKKADNGKTYILTATPASTLANWLEIGGGGGSVNLIPTGAWNVGTTYAANDCVSLNGTSYVAIAATTGDDPETSPTFWQVLAEKGDTGAAGGITSVVAGTNVTIDNTDPDNPIINATGGGGSGNQRVDEGYPPLNAATGSSASSFASVGSAFVCDHNCTITRMAVNHKPTAGRTYRFAIWNYNTSTNTLGSEVGHVDTVAATTSANLVLLSSDAVSLSLTAGTTYLFTITDVTGGNVGLGFQSGNQSSTGFMGHCPAVDGYVRTATNPLVAGTVMSDAGSFAVGWRLLGELT